MSGIPEDPVTELAQMANHLHELFTELMRAGFDEDQAMELVKSTINSGSK